MSKDGATIISLVGAEEHILKSSNFIKNAKNFKHFRELGSDRKKQYMRLFPRRLERIQYMLEVIRIYTSINSLQNNIDKLNPIVVIIDDKLYPHIRHPRKIKESRVREKHRKALTIIADNLANYFRMLLNNNPRKYNEELNRIKK